MNGMWLRASDVINCALFRCAIFSGAVGNFNHKQYKKFPQERMRKFSVWSQQTFVCGPIVAVCFIVGLRCDNKIIAMK